MTIAFHWRILNKKKALLYLLILSISARFKSINVSPLLLLKQLRHGTLLRKYDFLLTKFFINFILFFRDFKHLLFINKTFGFSRLNHRLPLSLFRPTRTSSFWVSLSYIFTFLASYILSRFPNLLYIFL